MEDILVPIFICALMPVTIVWIVFWFRKNRIERKAALISEAMEKGTIFDAEQIQNFDGSKKRDKSYKSRVLLNLKRGAGLLGVGIGCAVAAFSSENYAQFYTAAAAILGLLGIAFIIVYFISRKLYATEIEAESKRNVEKLMEQGNEE